LGSLPNLGPPQKGRSQTGQPRGMLETQANTS
jgi:hypothetical protein